MSEPAPSRSRRLAREVAFLALYSIQIGGAELDEALEDALGRHPLSDGAAGFTRNIVSGVMEHQVDLDARIGAFLAKGWEVDRLAVSDLLALRIGAWEIDYRPEMPPKVTISQAVDLAKRYGNKDSGPFVNGVLGSLLANSPKAEWTPPEGSELRAEERDEDIVADDRSEPAEEPKVSAWVLKSEED